MALLLAADFNNWIPAFRLQNIREVDTLFSSDAQLSLPASAQC